jgi:hypothetical protein
MKRVELMMEDGLEARSHKFGTACQYCGVRWVADKYCAVSILTFLACKTASTFSFIHDGNWQRPASSGIVATYRNRLCLVLGYQ